MLSDFDANCAPRRAGLVGLGLNEKNERLTNRTLLAPQLRQVLPLRVFWMFRGPNFSVPDVTAAGREPGKPPQVTDKPPRLLPSAAVVFRCPPPPRLPTIKGVPSRWYSLNRWSLWAPLTASFRSEERRVGKECRSRWSP